MFGFSGSCIVGMPTMAASLSALNLSTCRVSDRSRSCSTLALAVAAAVMAATCLEAPFSAVTTAAACCEPSSSTAFSEVLSRLMTAALS